MLRLSLWRQVVVLWGNTFWIVWNHSFEISRCINLRNLIHWPFSAAFRDNCAHVTWSYFFLLLKEKVIILHGHISCSWSKQTQSTENTVCYNRRHHFRSFLQCTKERCFIWSFLLEIGKYLKSMHKIERHWLGENQRSSEILVSTARS